MRSTDSDRLRRSNDNNNRRERTFQLIADVTRQVNEGAIPDLSDNDPPSLTIKEATDRVHKKASLSPPLSPSEERKPPQPPKRAPPPAKHSSGTTRLQPVIP